MHEQKNGSTSVLRGFNYNKLMMSADSGNKNACNLLSMESDEFISLSLRIHSSTTTVYSLVRMLQHIYMLPCYIIFLYL